MKVWLPRNAKRLAALTLALVLVLALAACGSKTQTPETSSTPTVVTPPVQTPADPASDPARPAGTETDQLTTVLDDIEKNVQVGAAGSSFLPVTVVSSSVSSRGSVTLPCWPGSPSGETVSRPRPANT